MSYAIVVGVLFAWAVCLLYAWNEYRSQRRARQIRERLQAPEHAGTDVDAWDIEHFNRIGASSTGYATPSDYARIRDQYIYCSRSVDEAIAKYGDLPKQQMRERLDEGDQQRTRELRKGQYALMAAHRKDMDELRDNYIRPWIAAHAPWTEHELKHACARGTGLLDELLGPGASRNILGGD